MVRGRGSTCCAWLVCLACVLCTLRTVQKVGSFTYFVGQPTNLRINALKYKRYLQSRLVSL